MKGQNLGEFEELVLLAAASLVSDAYSVAICEELSQKTKRDVKLGMVHAVLHRLEQKGLLKSKLGPTTAERGGKRKRMYTVTSAGKSALVKTREIREQFWKTIPGFQFKIQ